MAVLSLLHANSMPGGWQCYPALIAIQPHTIRCKCLKSWDFEEQEETGWDGCKSGSGDWGSGVRHVLDFTALDSLLQSVFDNSIGGKKAHAERGMDIKDAAVIGECVNRLEGVISSMRALGSGAGGWKTFLAGDLEQILFLLKGLLPSNREEQATNKLASTSAMLLVEETELSKDDVINLTLERADQLISGGQSWLLQQDAESILSSEMLTLAGEVERNMRIALRLLARAVELKPNSLTAVGMLANALLLQGQVKLRASQQLQAHQSTLAVGERAALERISQGCEQLLVEAGRVYRRALTINRKDFRALHNWGVALTCRAELLVNASTFESQEEEGSLECADKLYLAAIDKFEALVGLDRDHAAPALVDLALAVRGRSRVRKKSIQHRLNLLSQAQHLFCQAATLDPNQRLQLSGEALSCQEEINELHVIDT